MRGEQHCKVVGIGGRTCFLNQRWGLSNSKLLTRDLLQHAAKIWIRVVKTPYRLNNGFVKQSEAGVVLDLVSLGNST